MITDQVVQARTAVKISLAQVQAEEALIEIEHQQIQAEHEAFCEANAAILAKKAEFSQRMRKLKTPLIALREQHLTNVVTYKKVSGDGSETLLTS